ncbi:hypothetical protein F7R91_21890 [Streptomyces luteolifulvus]|uniref:Prevent-host-death family protein n=1 Tax=Streptomyces luteolifulvus TaxID=2615112 RepID=A0A6H9UYW0_9ACTN|nr:hypothetical protein [Streptomyces luteolifulvus]KAB1144469.1 hypothetical protein F7R91_21890 [Streptomyces luteolifulvus]
MTTHVDHPEAQSGAAQIYQLRDLADRPVEVMKEITESGMPALITLRGRMLAVITPFAEGDLESALVSSALKAGATEGLEARDRSLKSTEEMALKLGIDLPAYKDRDISH